MSAPGASNMIAITDEQHAEILRILGPMNSFQQELLAQVEEQEKVVLEEMKREEEKKEEMYTKYRQSQAARNAAAEWAAIRRFQSLPEAEKQRKRDEAQREMSEYLISREEFMKDLEARMAEQADEDSECSDEEEDVDDEEGSEEDEDEEEEEEEDWKDAWKKMTGHEWGNLTEEIYGPSREEPVPIMGPEEIFRRLCAPQMEALNEHKLAKSHLFDNPTPQPTRDIPDVLNFGEGQSSSKIGNSERSRSISCSSDSSSDFPMTMDQFFASRPTTPVNRETPDKFDSMVGQPPSLFNNSKSMPANRFLTSSGPKKAFPNVKKSSKSHKFALKRPTPTRILPPRTARNAGISKFGVDSDFH